MHGPADLSSDLLFDYALRIRLFALLLALLREFLIFAP